MSGPDLKRLPVFALPNLILYPGATLPLHLFEPRYRQLMEDLLAGESRELFLGTLLPDWEEEYFEAPPMAEVGGVGRVIQHRRDDDGNFDILVEGLHRARVVRELETDLPYRTVEVQSLDTAPTPAVQAPDLHRGVLDTLRRLAGTLPDGAEERSLDYLADILLVHLPLPTPRKIEFFSMESATARAQALIEEAARQEEIARSLPEVDERPEDPTWN